MNIAALTAIRTVLGPMTSEAKCREVYEAVLLSVREPDREMHTALSELGAITFGDLDERDQGTWFAVKGWRAMIGALLAE